MIRPIKLINVNDIIYIYSIKVLLQNNIIILQKIQLRHPVSSRALDCEQDDPGLNPGAGHFRCD
jgi:hypothetical protein